MCIVCNLPLNSDLPTEFLAAFADANASMKGAAASMLRCSEAALDPAVRKRYDATHKKMVRLIHEWNRLEEFREAGDTVHASGEKP